MNSFHLLKGFFPSLFSQPSVIHSLLLSDWMLSFTLIHALALHAPFLPSFSLTPLCFPSYARFTTVLFLLNIPSIIYSSLQQMTGKLCSCRGLSGTIQSCRTEWQRVGTICDTQSCKHLITSCLPLYLTGHGWLGRGLSFSQQWYQAELWRREGIHTQTHTHKCMHEQKLTRSNKHTRCNAATVFYWLY